MRLRNPLNVSEEYFSGEYKQSCVMFYAGNLLETPNSFNLIANYLCEFEYTGFLFIIYLLLLFIFIRAAS